MKYSFMTFSCPELTLDEALAAAKRFGYDAIEPRTVCKHRHGIETTLSAAERKAVRKRVADSGIAISCVATSHSYSDPAKAQAEVQGTIESAKLAADVGAPCLRVFGGQIAKGIERPQAVENLVNCLTAVAQETRGLPVTICMETHDDWCDPGHVAEVIRRVNQPHIAVNWDIMHPVRVAKKTIDEAFNAVKPWIRHIHFHDGVTRDGKIVMVPIGQGEVDHRRAVKLLKGIKYSGHLSGEWINWEPWEKHLPRELATMKKYEKGN